MTTAPEKMTISVSEHPSGMLIFEAIYHRISIAGVARDIGDMVACIQAHRKVIGQMTGVSQELPEGWARFEGGLENLRTEGLDARGNPTPYHVTLVRRHGYVRVGVAGKHTMHLHDEALRYLLDLDPE